MELVASVVPPSRPTDAKSADSPGQGRLDWTLSKIRIDTAKIKTEQNLDGEYLRRQTYSRSPDWQSLIGSSFDAAVVRDDLTG
jgi:hypothetical protein